ncbi:hypothetical protein NLI96_g5061 [Meripilus lineatus]|uniref:NAD-dependent epimerase/dehydratase domain-containing protein n=1 Tax=Meripilus lineatus TaxID=2056292 RepID=A0AAD5YHA9_9APHY|nr:hypothetical protein NLI96_g5061 [Physisporinus lineatus]
MPAVPAGSKILVTGANGFVAMWVVRTLLQSGYRVRGTIRSDDKGDFIKQYFSEFGDKLELSTVPDIEKDGAFDEAVKDVDAIEHTASPYHYGADDPAELIQPAIKGTVGILKSAMRCGSSVKRIVITTSTAAVVRPTQEPLLFNEDDWNNDSIRQVEEEGVNAPGYIKYFASKTLAEKAAFEFYNENRDSVKWDLVTIAPPYVFGPTINDVQTISTANTSIVEWYETIFESAKGTLALSKVGNAWLDVRDLALAHVRAIQRQEAQGRIIVSSGSFKWHDFCESGHTPRANELSHPYSRMTVTSAKSLSPRIYRENAFTPADPNYDPNKAVHELNFDTSKAERLLGMTEYIPLDKCTRDMLEDFHGRGW